ncbi:hypothetical protein CRYUN_Cryun39dG0025600 [Craigia yunnanensis]
MSLSFPSLIVVSMDLFLQQLTMFTTFLFLPLMINSVSFNITHFDSKLRNIEYRGDARHSSGIIELNTDYIYLRGQVICREPVRLQDFDKKQLADFTTHFSFIIDTLRQNPQEYGDGLVFFIVPVGFQSPASSAGGGLGLFPNILMSELSQQKHQIVTVEFDSFVNKQWDPPYEHVGINMNSLNSSVYTPWNSSFHSGHIADVWISYNSSTKKLSVSWSYQVSSSPQENSTLTFYVDLREVLPMEWVTVGIGAATGLRYERHILKSWQFSSTLDSMEIKGSKSDKIKMIILLCFGALIVGSVVTYFTIWGRNKLRNKQNIGTEGISLIWIIHDIERRAGPKRFSYKDLVSATNNFSDDRKLGQGGFGAVYKGHLTELDIDVAVKKFFGGSKLGGKDYIAEVTIVSRLRHRNLVHLIGWCHDRGQFLLVYEFMPNGSLDSHLFSNNCTLTWPTRYKICLGLGTAMFYLHNEWEQCVVHRDIKTGNVMLDSSFNVKLGDFGLARLMDHELGPRTTCLAGTLGYMAPEYVISGKASCKSDVFSFGVVTLEIVTGRKARDPIDNEMGLTQWVWDLYGQKKPLAVVDERLQMEFDEQQAKCMVLVGLWCAHPDYTLRPSIRQAIQVLNFEAEIPDLPLQMPVPMYQVPSASPPKSLVEPLISNSFSETGR